MSMENGTKYVKWQVFVWAIGILTTITLLSFGLSGSAKSDAGEAIGESKSIKTDIDWIKKSLERIEGNLK